MQNDDFLNDVELRKKILQCVREDRYQLTRHALEQQKKRGIDLPDLVHVLKTGTHEKSKTTLEKQVWKYAITGKAEDSRKIRIIIAFKDEMIVITVIRLK